MDPRIGNSATALSQALDSAGVDYRNLSEEDVEIGGTRFRLMPIGIVRDRDATLIVHIQNGPGRPTKGYVAGIGQNDIEILGSSKGHRHEPTFIVADRISALARDELSSAGIAWLDRRGHLWVKTDGIYVNADVPASVAPVPRVVEILSGTGFDVAFALLTSPHEDVGVNELARRIDRSPGRVSEILTALRGEGLVEGGNRPSVPELFWDVAERWRPRWVPLSAEPPAELRERYRLSGTLGAISLEAPLMAGARGTRPSLYVSGDPELASLVTAYGQGGFTAAEVAVSPSRYGASLKSKIVRDGYPVAHAVLIALDLAQDRARGQEILDGWNPVEATRVW